MAYIFDDITAKVIPCFNEKEGIDQSEDSEMHIDPSDMPISYKLHLDGTVIDSLSDQLGAVRSNVPIPIDASAYYFEVQIEVYLMDYIYIILPFLPFVMELFTSDRMQ
jgi:hypothetical protein